MTHEEWEHLARCTTKDFSDDQIRQIATLCVKWDAAGNGKPSQPDKPFGVWHAASVVAGTQCHCKRCNP